MRMRTLRKIQKLAAPRMLRHREFDLTDATMESDPGAAPEAVFDRVTGPFAGSFGRAFDQGSMHRARTVALASAFDEET